MSDDRMCNRVINRTLRIEMPKPGCAWAAFKNPSACLIRVCKRINGDGN